MPSPGYLDESTISRDCRSEPTWSGLCASSVNFVCPSTMPGERWAYGTFAVAALSRPPRSRAQAYVNVDKIT